MNETHPSDLEELAAYIDGRLSGERKVRVEKRLLRNEDYYEVFLGTVRFQQENGKGQKVPVTPLVRWRTWGIATSLAAAAVLVIVITLPRSDRDGSPGAWAAQLDADAVVARGEAWTDPGWSRMRSATTARGHYRPEELAFRLGVRAVDLRVALAAGDRRTAAILVAQSEALAGAADLFPVASSYGFLRQQVDGTDPEALLAQVAETEGHLAESFEDGSPEARRFALGGWAEAGRLAALTRDADALARILRNAPDAGSSEEIRPQVETLELVLERPDPNHDDFDAAAAAFSEILRALAG